MIDIIILGMIENKPSGGYDIQLILEQTKAQQWANVNVGSIYHALNKLERKKYIKEYETKYIGKRKKIVYQITQAGIIHLDELLIKTFTNNRVIFPTDLYSCISIIERIKLEDIVNILHNKKSYLENELLDLKNNMALKKEYNGKLLPLEIITFNHMENVIRNDYELIKGYLEYYQGRIKNED